MIYVIPNFVTSVTTYICPDQATIDVGVSKQYEGNFIVGEQAAAQSVVSKNRQEYLITIEDRFSVCKDTDVTEGRCWETINLDTETDNIDVDYQIFSVKDGDYTMVKGLNNAKELLANTKQIFVEWALNYVELEQWPTQSKQPVTTGTQEF